MRGSTYKRCGCTDSAGRLLGRRCAKLRGSRHGAWYFALWIPMLDNNGRRQVRKGGTPTLKAPGRKVLAGTAGTAYQAPRSPRSPSARLWSAFDPDR
jgi:hypothetical protein